ncbi:MAG: DUF2298 domain-containing protein [Candidatus Levyibacteriota bacterium]
MTDILFTLQWWLVLFGIGLIFLPLTKYLFPDAKDSFYIFSKVLGAGVISYLMFLLGSFHILPFTFFSVLFIILIIFLLIIFLIKKRFIQKPTINNIIVFEEFFFFVALLFWSWVRSFEPSIHGLEKFMDFGFVNSILRAEYFPPKDMWFTPFSINYYYFGHLITAVLTKLSGIPSNITYNLMIATLFAFTFTCSFSLLYNFLQKFGLKKSFLGGLLTGLLTSLGGNLHTIYSFFAPYKGEQPVPFWTLRFQPNLFPNAYWYPNATRFIPFTIHEFPIYSFVVSDLHGHVTDIPFVLLTLAILWQILLRKKLTKPLAALTAFLFAVMYMTNAWDGIIYLLLFLLVLTVIHVKDLNLKKGRVTPLSFFRAKGLRTYLENIVLEGGLTGILYIIITVPFSLHFKPFVSGIGVVCAPPFLTALGRFGPFLFEANHCQRSPLYQLLILYGFFIFFNALFAGLIIQKLISAKKKLPAFLDTQNIFIFLLALFSFLLILIPEFIYAKDIYPQHYRANTMFKLVYQAFILLSLTSGYIIVFFASTIKSRLLKSTFLLVTFILICLVFIYPYFAITSYYGNLKTRVSLDGTNYLKGSYPGDLEAINFLNSKISGQPIILEAQGDSYTDYARISANTGLPTVLGWTVHEWLWRGTYDIPAPRIEEVKTMYEGGLSTAEPLLKKYNVSLVIIGALEREKYPGLQEGKFSEIGKVIFTSSDQQTKVYQLEQL